MLRTSVPAKFPIPFASGAGGSFIRPIPEASQIGIQGGAASLTDGFPPLNAQPIAAGGVPPFMQDMNGLEFQITANIQWAQAGGFWTYDSGFSTAIGGYPQGALLESAIMPGRLWVSLLDNNTQNPDAYPFTGWAAAPGGTPPGTPIPSFQATVLPGCVIANGLTIGNVGSGGTTAPTSLASATAFFLYCAVWLQFSQSECPVQFNGATVARGANPNADWLAGNVIQLPWMAGAGLIGQDNMGSRTSTFLNGVPVQSGSLILPGSIIGENTHALNIPELPPVTPSVAVSQQPSYSFQFTVLNNGLTGGVANVVNSIEATGGSTSVTPSRINDVQITSSPQGGGQAHNNAERSFAVAWNLAL